MSIFIPVLWGGGGWVEKIENVFIHFLPPLINLRKNIFFIFFFMGVIFLVFIFHPLVELSNKRSAQIAFGACLQIYKCPVCIMCILKHPALKF